MYGFDSDCNRPKYLNSMVNVYDPCLLKVHLLKSIVNSQYWLLFNQYLYLHDMFYSRRKIRLVEDNAKCRHLKFFTCKGTLRQVFIFMRKRTPPPPPPHYTQGGGIRTREKVKEAKVHKAGSKIPT
jgi:hypothetical protein